MFPSSVSQSSPISSSDTPVHVPPGNDTRMQHQPFYSGVVALDRFGTGGLPHGPLPDPYHAAVQHIHLPVMQANAGFPPAGMPQGNPYGWSAAYPVTNSTGGSAMLRPMGVATQVDAGVMGQTASGPMPHKSKSPIGEMYALRQVLTPQGKSLSMVEVFPTIAKLYAGGESASLSNAEVTLTRANVPTRSPKASDVALLQQVLKAMSENDIVMQPHEITSNDEMTYIDGWHFMANVSLVQCTDAELPSQRRSDYAVNLFTDDSMSASACHIRSFDNSIEITYVLDECINEESVHAALQTVAPMEEVATACAKAANRKTLEEFEIHYCGSVDPSEKKRETVQRWITYSKSFVTWLEQNPFESANGGQVCDLRALLSLKAEDAWNNRVDAYLENNKLSKRNHQSAVNHLQRFLNGELAKVNRNFDKPHNVLPALSPESEAVKRAFETAFKNANPGIGEPTLRIKIIAASHALLNYEELGNNGSTLPKDLRELKRDDEDKFDKVMADLKKKDKYKQAAAFLNWCRNGTCSPISHSTKFKLKEQHDTLVRNYKEALEEHELDSRGYPVSAKHFLTYVEKDRETTVAALRQDGKLSETLDDYLSNHCDKNYLTYIHDFKKFLLTPETYRQHDNAIAASGVSSSSKRKRRPAPN